MSKINKHIEIVHSTTKGLSSMSKVSCDSIFTTLSKHFARVGITIVNNLSDLEGLLADSPDLVFLGMEFIPSDSGLGLADPNKIWLSDFLDGNNIAYTGSSQVAHELERNKPLAKQNVLDADLRTSAFCVIEQNQTLDSNDVPLNYPLFIKPTSRGGGQGIDSDSVVHNFEQLSLKVQAITTRLRSDVLVEEYLPGREFSVAILKDEDSAGYLAMPLELVAPPDKNGARLLSGQIKSSNTEVVLVVTDEVIKSKVTALALKVFHALGARDYGRIDIRLDAAGSPHFLEANLIPSLICGYGSFPKACVLNIGMEYEAMIMRIAKLGLAHKINDIEDDLESIEMIDPVYTATKVAFELA
jgi:D-alanine-D-alanine ligase